jgi:argininosuccinate lyase
MPGFTHLQTAQPVTFGHHLMAYVEMVGRDRGRLADARRGSTSRPLGSAALAGTSFPHRPRHDGEGAPFDRPTANSLDAVSDRDFVIETLCGSDDLRRCICRASPRRSSSGASSPFGPS